MKLTEHMLDQMISEFLDITDNPKPLNESQAKKRMKLTPQLLKKLLKEQLEKQTYEWVLLPPPS